MFLFLKKTWKIGLSILFGVAVLLFWGSVYPAHISYQEQFQLVDGGDFGDILSDMVSFSGGFFIGEDPFEAALTVAELEPAYDAWTRP